MIVAAMAAWRLARRRLTTQSPAYDGQLGDELDGRPLDRALLTALVELVGTGTIADVGCGPGHVTRYLAKQHADVVGVDLSPGMITVVRERATGTSSR